MECVGRVGGRGGGGQREAEGKNVSQPGIDPRARAVLQPVISQTGTRTSSDSAKATRERTAYELPIFWPRKPFCTGPCAPFERDEDWRGADITGKAWVELGRGSEKR